MQPVAAQLKIRQLSLEIVEHAFTEEAFPLLADDLKAELAIRKAKLQAQQPQPIAPQQGFNLAKQVVFWLGLALVVWVIALANQRPSDSPRLQQAPASQPQ
jgi:hypothetical protein